MTVITPRPDHRMGMAVITPRPDTGSNPDENGRITTRTEYITIM